MRSLRPLSAGLFAAVIAFLVVHASGCGTDAVGVDECRDIEYARCAAARYCGLIDNTDSAVDACKRFYRDQCLHGLASGERPGGPKVKDCVAVINTAAQCAKNGQDVIGSSDPSQCDLSKLRSPLTTLTDTCDIVRQPEQVQACEFLAEPVQVPDASPDAVEASDDASDSGDAAAE
jgi:hypothetical protein